MCKSSSKRMTKREILSAIENLPGNYPFSAESVASVWFASLSRRDCVEWYNHLVRRRGLDFDLIS